MVHVSIVKVLGFSQAEHLLALGIGKEFTVMVEQFEGIPLFGVMRSGNDDTPTGMLAHDCQLGSRRCRQSDVDHIKAHTHERADNGIQHHAARQTGVTSHDDDVGLDGRIATHEGSVSRSEFDDIERREAVTGFPADGAANA